MKIAVVTDSTAYLEPEVAEQYGIKVVPIPFIIDNKVYNEGIDITTEEFYSKLKTSESFPSTSQPAIGELINLYTSLGNEGYDAVISIHLAGTISGLVQTIENIREQVTNIDVIPFDSKITVRLMGNLAIASAKIAQAGKDIDEIIYKCVDIKRDVVEKDLYDFGDRLCLNFGHTIGHSIEQHFHYEKYSHGEAVGIGMVAITRIAELKGLCEKGTTKRIEDALGHYNLPTQANVPTKELLKAIDLDKKNINSTLSFVLLKTIGEYYVHKDQKEMILEVEDI